MVVVQASKLNLPYPSLSSMLFEPNSLSLALMHSDSSFSLYHSLSDLSSSSSSSSLLAHPRIVIPPPSSSSCFVSIQNPNSSDSRTIFVVSGPHDGGSRICLRFHVLIKNKGFSRARVVCNQKGIEFDKRLGVLVNCVHGVSIKLAGSVNFFAMNLASSSEVWIFAVRLVSDEVVKLMRCAVIECRKPVFSIGIFYGLLVFGEENGVRFFSMRQLVKGTVRKVKTSPQNSSLDSQRLRLSNGVVNGNMGLDLAHRCGKCNAAEGNLEIPCNCRLDEKNHHKVVSSAKHRAIRLQQDSSEVGTCFVAFSSRNVEASASMVVKSLKATSIQALFPKKFLILDSTGNLHLMCLSSSVIGSDITSQMQQLPRVMNVQKLAVLADSSTETQTVWVSNGSHSLHMIVLPDMDVTINETVRTDKLEIFARISVVETIFACEKIEDVTPLAGNAILILGQGTLYAYEVS